MRRTLIRAIIGLQILAFVLAFIHVLPGIQTDEAKYLLGIPYPHPPVLRTILAWTSALPGHAVFWRVVFATVAVHSVWIVWDLTSVLPRGRRVLLCFLWLSASPFLLQAGTVMLVQPTALFGLLALRLATDRGEISRASLASMALGWLLALGTAYQMLLFAPLVWAAMRRARPTRWMLLLHFVTPILLLGVYTITNPLAVASMVAVSTQDGAVALLPRIQGILWVWALAGGALTVVGLWGILVTGQRALQFSTLLVLVYTALSAQQYYAILLLPLLLGGVFHLACHRRLRPALLLPLHVASTAFFLFLAMPGLLKVDQVQPTIAFLQQRGLSRPLLIDGPFGHDWQYWSPVPVVRFSPLLAVAVEDQSQFLVCTRAVSCASDIDLDRWQRLDGAPVEVWRNGR